MFSLRKSEQTIVVSIASELEKFPQPLFDAYLICFFKFRDYKLPDKFTVIARQLRSPRHRFFFLSNVDGAHGNLLHSRSSLKSLN